MLRFPDIKELEYIRTLQDKNEDYAGVAECFNSFKDSDSWPGGFGGSQIFTMESVKEYYENKDLENYFVALAPDDPKKIVGVCILNRSWIIPDAWYVALLGIMPSYQGKKLGKALLLAATKLCTEKKVRFLSLHTWEGNLKAMPLYKRQGYKWRPKTSVYMENYIPQILNFPLFKAFFEEHCWYDVFRPVINQAMDDERQDGMLIYEYYFEADKDNFIKVWIDRTIGKIAGFHFKHKEKELIVKGITKTEAFIGIDEFAIKLSVENRSNEPIKLHYKVSSSQDVKLAKDENNELLVSPNETKNIEFTAVLTSQSEEIDLDREPDEYSKSEINFEIEYQETRFQLAVGKLPKKLVDAYTFPFNYPWITEKGRHTIPLNIENKSEKELEIEVKLIDGKSITFEKKTVKAKISPYDTTLYLEANVSEITNSVDKFSIKLLHNKRTLLEKTLNIVLSQIGKAYAYETKDHIFIENELLRVRLFKKSSTLQNSIQISDKTGELTAAITGYAPILGIPFDDEGSEFFSMDLTHEIIETEQGLILKSSAISEIKRGIKLTRYLLLPNIGDTWHVWFEVENTTENSVKDIGILITLWGWNAGRLVNEVYFPFLEGIKAMNTYEIRPYLGADPESFKEGWIAAVFDNKALGTIFEPKEVDKIVIKAFPEIEYIFGNLKPYQKKATPQIHYTLTKDWQTVQKRWRELTSQSVIEQMGTKALSTDLVRIGLISKAVKEPSLALLVDDDKQIKVEIDAFREAGIKGKVKIDLDCLEKNPTELKIPLTKATKWQEKLNIESNFKGL
ncbi:MAG: GNAT family N-acetyltransferase, partial [Candidatus Heimdallarchaeaceae archaeon]